VDGTLIHGSSPKAEESVHCKAFCHAVGKVLGGFDSWESQISTPLAVVPSEKFHGCTDGLVSLNLAKYGLGLVSSHSFPHLKTIFQTMYEYVSKFSDDEFIQGIEPLPSVISTLSLLNKRHQGNILCGLVTGNIEGIARYNIISFDIL